MLTNFQQIPIDCGFNRDQECILRKPYNESCFTRAVAYASETDGIALRVLSMTGEGKTDLRARDPVVDCGVLSVVGVASGYFPFIASTCIFNPTTAAALAPCGIVGAVGMAAGLVIFEGLIVAKNISKIAQSPHYLAWKQRRLELITNKAVVEFLHVDNIFKHLLCPISNKIPLLPTKGLDHLY